MFGRSKIFGPKTERVVNPSEIQCPPLTCENLQDCQVIIDLQNQINSVTSNEIEVIYFSEINSDSGTIIIPAGATIQLDQLPGGVDAFVNTIANGQPTGTFPSGSSGEVIDVAVFDMAGNFTLTGVPNGYPCALIYVLKIAQADMGNLDLSKVIEFWEPKVINDFEKEFLIASTSWVVNHDLGKEPDVTILNSLNEEIVGALVHNTINQFTVTFNTAKTGKVKYR